MVVPVVSSPPRVAVLVSGGGGNLQAIIDAVADGTLNAHIVAVVSNRPEAFAIERARSAGIAHRALTVDEGESRRSYDRRLAELVGSFSPDVVVLAGWMRILSTEFIEHFPNRILNIHPALPGELPGMHAVERAWHEMMAGERTTTGVMIHLVPDEGVDDGPVLATAPVEIRLDDTLDALTERVHATEHRLMVETLATFLTELTERP